ncbi:MAG: hypothetical protein KFH87_00905 [Bacteroidetes bacterium]|nr:hypothetical protein [Bacteroidota bacterium]
MIHNGPHWPPLTLHTQHHGHVHTQIRFNQVSACDEQRSSNMPMIRSRTPCVRERRRIALTLS